MKLAIASDIHLEFGDCDLENTHQADVLVLSGDICVAADLDPAGLIEEARGHRTRDFFARVSDRFPHTVMIMGNHEHYNGDFNKTQDLLQAMLDEGGMSNVHLLEKSTWQWHDWLFIGGTLWTDFNGEDGWTMWDARNMMNDFHSIRRGDREKFLPQHALEDHQQMKRYISEVIEVRRKSGRRDNRVILVGHHSPSDLSVHAKYRNQHHMNGCYRSRMEGFMQDHAEIQLWTHGHTHEDFDYMIGTTRVICNPRGYKGVESRADTWTLKYVDCE